MAGLVLWDIHLRFTWQAWFCVAGVAICEIHLHFVWQAWHLMTWIVTLRGRHGTYGTGLALVARLVPRRRSDAAAFCVAGVALCDIHLHFVWQAWHLMTWIVTLRGTRGTCGTGLALVARLVPRRRSDAAAFCVARGTWWHGLLLCVAGVPLMALGWLWWRAWFPDTAADMGAALPEGVQDTQPVRAQLRDLFRAAQWLCRFTFRENDYQQTLELECRHLTPCLRASRAEAVVAPEALNRKVSHCQMNNGCPVAPLATLQVDAQLGLISVDDVEASFVRCLVAFNNEQLPDEEALQQDNTSTSAMRVKRSVDCLLSAPAATGGPSRVKLRCAGPALAVAWLLRGNVGEAHFVVLAHTSDPGEWSVLWHVPVEAHRVQGVKNFMLRIYESEVKSPQTLTYDQAWTPMKRLASVMETAPEDASMTQKPKWAAAITKLVQKLAKKIKNQWKPNIFPFSLIPIRVATTKLAQKREKHLKPLKACSTNGLLRRQKIEASWSYLIMFKVVLQLCKEGHLFRPLAIACVLQWKTLGASFCQILFQNPMYLIEFLKYFILLKSGIARIICYYSEVCWGGYTFKAPLIENRYKSATRLGSRVTEKTKGFEKKPFPILLTRKDKLQRPPIIWSEN